MKDIRFSSKVPFTSAVSHIPEIPQKLRRLVVQALTDAAREFSRDEINYIRLKITKKIERVRTNSTFWVREIAEGYNALYSWFEQELSDEDNIESELVRKVGAVLFYFINPFDVIPDYNTKTGYADDALALNYVLRSLPDNWLSDEK